MELDRSGHIHQPRKEKAYQLKLNKTERKTKIIGKSNKSKNINVKIIDMIYMPSWAKKETNFRRQQLFYLFLFLNNKNNNAFFLNKTKQIRLGFVGL